MQNILPVENFLEKLISEKILLIDSRSEKEFEHAHIPGAVNIPLLNNDHRHLVGIEYKKNGREAAVEMGFELVGPLFHEKIKAVKNFSNRKEVMIYCWRGGMRSSIMAWVLSLSGYKTTMLKGGYKFFRGFVLQQFEKPWKIKILGGHTGCGKTEVLKELKKLGEQIIDLEGLANHKGSAFGSLGLPEQPSNEYFENLLAIELSQLNLEKEIWVEAESRSIGRIKIPDEFFFQLDQAPLYEIIASRKFRCNRINEEYCKFPKDELAECTNKIAKRLGGLKLKEAINALNENRYEEWLNILLDYYDKTYMHSLNERKSIERRKLHVDDLDKSSVIAERLKMISGELRTA